MSDKYIEKAFLYLLALSVLLHIGVFGVFSQLETEKPKVKEEPIMVELGAIPDLPAPTPPPPPQVEAPRQVPPPKPVPRPKSKPLPLPKITERIDNVPPLPKTPTVKKEAKVTPRSGVPDARRGTGATEQAPKAAPSAQEALRQVPPSDGSPASRGDDIFKPRKGKEIELAKLFPSQKKMASIEEGYRKKYEGAEQGDTRMIDTDDPLISVYSHRLLVAANDSLRILSRRTATHGVGVGVLQVTIRRDGTIENVKMVESTKSRVLDDLALTAVRETGYVGPLPKKWPHEKLNLLWIFVSSQTPQP